MRRSRLIWVTLLARWRGQLGVVLGTAIAAMVLTGALVIGDSVQHTLQRQATLRIGSIGAIVHGQDRFLGADLATILADDLGNVVAPVVHVRGVVTSSDGRRAARNVNIYGVDERFFELSPGGVAPPNLASLANTTLTNSLATTVGDDIVVRVELPSAMPRDAVLGDRRDTLRGWRVTLNGTATDDQFGRFGLHADLQTPPALFMPIADLQTHLDIGPRANLLLFADPDADRVRTALDHHFRSDDAQITVREVPDSAEVELISERIFVEPAIEAIATTSNTAITGALTYFVNSIEHDEHVTPYSMVTAIGPLTSPDAGGATVIPGDLGDDEIVINDWLANDLACTTGDAITLRYFVLDDDGRLVETSSDYRVRSVIPMTGAAADRTLMPDFPGIAEAESSQDWEPGIPIDLGRIRDTDEAYWDAHRGTPKAFITLAAGRQAWGNRYGELTAVRFADTETETIRTLVTGALNPAAVGFAVRDLRSSALSAGRSTTDFGGLFLGLSLFLIAASLGLAGLLFVFTVEQRATEVGVLRAMGYRARHVRSLIMREGTLVAVGASIIGALGSIPYTALVLTALRSIWSDAIASAAVTLSVRPLTLAIGAGATIIAAIVAMRLALRHPLRQSPLTLIRGNSGQRGADERGRPVWTITIATAALLGALAMLISGLAGDGLGITFFGAGALMLISGIAAVRIMVVLLGSRRGEPLGTVSTVAMRALTRQLNRSVVASALLASGTFLVLSMAVHQLETSNTTDRSSGTGGFAFIGESTMRLHVDPDEQRGRDTFGIGEDELTDTSFVSLRVRVGDEASCLNLNRPQVPRLVGVTPAHLQDRSAFSFARELDGTDRQGWDLLNAVFDDGAVPAIGDHASVTWALHKSVGDRIVYTDEHGRSIPVVIVGTVANSILQGNLVIAEDRFRTLYPSEDGYRMFLIDTPAEQMDAVEQRLEHAMSDVGLDLIPTAERLAVFNAVQNTYLSIFQLLGGLGVLLGTVGLGVVVARNVLDRRRELGVLRAVGWSLRSVRRLVFVEHLVILASGLTIGVIAAGVAVIPSVTSGPSSFPLTFVAIMTLTLIGNGLFWVWAATRMAVAGPMLDALRGVD